VEAVARVKRGLNFLGGAYFALKVHLSFDYIVDGLEHIGAVFAASAGKEMAQAHSNNTVVHILRVVQAGCADVKVLGSLITVGFVFSGDFIAHN
jgi:hypothetical protein